MKLLVLYICYLVLLYSTFWVNSDTLESDSRFQQYHSQISDFNCYTEKISKGNGERSRLYVELAEKQELDFYLPHQDCDYVNRAVPNYLGRMFSGYFDGGIVMQLTIGNTELVSFSDERKRMNMFVVYIALMPLVCWMLIQYFKYRRSKRLSV